VSRQFQVDAEAIARIAGIHGELTMYPEGNLFIPAPHGRLEAILKEPRESGDIRGVALALHPHPLHGGTMHNKVVYRAASALNEAGLVSLRINFRGVGQSTGEHGDGRSEQEDVIAALDYLSENYPSQEITLAGFSFGSRVGLEVGIADSRVARLIGLGVPLSMYDVTFLHRCHKPILFVQGEHDEFGNVEELRALVELLPADAQAKLVVVPGAGHFFEGHLDDMKRAIIEWIDEQLNSNRQENTSRSESTL
jgi:alpha/beta superfamily hydrolase